MLKGRSKRFEVAIAVRGYFFRLPFLTNRRAAPAPLTMRILCLEAPSQIAVTQFRFEPNVGSAVSLPRQLKQRFKWHRSDRTPPLGH